MEQTITWLGHGSWRMVTPKGTNVYLDPWIEGNPTCPITLDDIDQADVVCVTHGHSDHLGNAIEIVQKTGATLVTLPEVAAYCSNHGIPYDDKGGAVHTGGSVVQKDLRIHAVFALHSSDIMGKEFAEDNTLMPGSGTCGMILTPENGTAVYFAGDTGVFGDMALIGKLYHPKIAVLPIGGKYTMGVYEAAYAMELLGCEILIPGHYDTFPSQMADTDDLVQQVAARCPQARVILMKPGESIAV